MRNSILSVDITDAEVDGEDYVEDNADLEEYVRAHRNGDDASGSGSGLQGMPHCCHTYTPCILHILLAVLVRAHARWRLCIWQ